MLQGKELLSFLDLISWEEFVDESLKFKNFLLNERLENYGYDRKDFVRIQSQRRRVKAVFRFFSPVSALVLFRTVVQNPRVCRYSTGKWDYIVGQSRNEEITNLIADLCLYKKKGWLS